MEIKTGDVDVTVQSAETVLLTGRSGAGKTTLLRAIVGEPSTGIRVVLGDTLTSNIDQRKLAGHVTLVAQDAYTFDGTIRENLHLADPTAVEAELWAALAAAALDDLVAGFPGGLETPVGPRWRRESTSTRR